MSKPKNMTPEQEDAWKAKKRERMAKYNAKPEVKAKKREYMAKYDADIATQAAADQFFIMAGAAQTIIETISKLKNK